MFIVLSYPIIFKFEIFKFSFSLKCKTATPFGHVPILEVDGRVLAQSNTIARYLAKKHGLAGQDEWEEALADMYADNIHDLLNGNLQLYAK